jgi:hypothetical protein
MTKEQQPAVIAHTDRQARVTIVMRRTARDPAARVRTRIEAFEDCGQVQGVTFESNDRRAHRASCAVVLRVER